jgi:hypothetical protein
MANATQIINANTASLLEAAHASGADAGTVLTLADSKGVTQKLRLYSGTTATLEKDEAGNALLGIKLADGSVVTRPFDQVPNAMAFAVEVAEKNKGNRKLVGSRWVDTDTPAGAKAVELNKSNFKGLANNPDYTWGKAAKLYSDKSNVGTSACGTAASTFPDTLRIPIEGVVVAPKTPPKAKVAPKAAPKAKKAKKATKSELLGANKNIVGKTLAEIRASARKLSSSVHLRKIIKLEGYTPKPKSSLLRLRNQLDEIWAC